MPEYSSFFDETAEDPRFYTADQFAEYFRCVLTNGIFNGGTNLKVEADGDNMIIRVLLGYAWNRGYMYKVYDDPLPLTVDTADPSQDRIDRVVLRLDTSLEVREVNAKIIKGEPSSNPAPPAIVRQDNIFDLSIAQIRVIAGKSFIEGSQVTDERLNAEVCGLVNSLIQADTTEIFNQFQAWYNSRTAEYQQQWSDWFAQMTSTILDDWDDMKQAWIDWFTNQKTEGFVMANEKGQPDGVLWLDHEGKAPLDQLPNLDYVPLSQKGAPGGVATLDGEGNLAQIPFVTGAYTGNGVTSRIINLGFRPSAVLVIARDFATNSSSGMYSGFALDGFAVIDRHDRTVLEVTATGFRVHNQFLNSNTEPYNPFRYIAFK